MSFGVRLTEARKAKGLTQSDLGKGLGTDGADASKAVVYGWEKDQHFPRADQLTLVCEKLGVSADWLLRGAASENSLSPDVAEVASHINSLPEKWRKWVLRSTREAIDVALEAIELNANGYKGAEAQHSSDDRHTTKRAKGG